MTLPTRDEIDVHHSLDEIAACKHFLGKSLEEAEALFRENSLYYQEDLMWMGPAAFRFYIHAAIHYVKSDEATGDSDIINCLALNIRYRLFCEPPTEFQPVADLLASFCKYVVEHFDRFEVEPEIYGDLPGEYEKLGTEFAQLGKEYLS